ncbi:C10 family peptidase [Planctomycetota bacterium]
MKDLVLFGYFGRFSKLFVLIIISFLILLCLYSAGLQAKPVSDTEAVNMVRGWLKADAQPLGTRLGRDIESVQTFSDENGQGLYYVIYLQPAGFVIVPADDMVEPIIAFAQKGAYDPSPQKSLGALVESDVPARIDAVRQLRQQIEGKAQATLGPDRIRNLQSIGLKAQDKWTQLTDYADKMGTLGISSVSDPRVGPLTQSTWGQGNVEGYSNTDACYNYYTPPGPDGSSDNWPCGCVATSMAQTMRYHEYAAGGYVWAHMPLQPEIGVITLTERQTIGDFCFDIAESVNTSYGSGGSSAYLSDASEELRYTFGYSNSIHIYNASGIMSYLDDMVNPNLDASHPVILGIDGPYGGHAVVCDGYGYNASTLYHHLNMGWDGREDAWYDLPNIDSSPYNFTAVEDCTYNIFTTGSGEIISGRVTDDTSGDPISDVTVTAEGSGGPYTDETDDNGIYALAKIPSSTSFTVSASKSGWSFSSQGVTTGTSSDNSDSGNRWGINFVGTISGPSPPIAEPDSVSVEQGVAETIDLQASDEGLPDPPAQLTYIITSLPDHGELSDHGAGVISDADLPYTLVGNGNQVDYSSCGYYVGPDSFGFKANDGGTAPDGGDSNIATITIDVQLAASTVIYETNFDGGLPSGWTIIDGFSDGYTWTTTNMYTPPWTGTFMIVGYGDTPRDMDEQLITHNINCSGTENVTLSFKYEFKHYTNEVGDVDVRVGAGAWQNVARYDTPGEYTISGVEELDISAIADDQSDVQIRWYYYNADFEWYWAIDDVQITGTSPQQDPLPGDFQMDCNVDFVDFAILGLAWMTSSGEPDYNPDCDISLPPDDTIDLSDLLVLTDNWLNSAAP